MGATFTRSHAHSPTEARVAVGGICRPVFTLSASLVPAEDSRFAIQLILQMCKLSLLSPCAAIQASDAASVCTWVDNDWIFIFWANYPSNAWFRVPHKLRIGEVNIISSQFFVTRFVFLPVSFYCTDFLNKIWIVQEEFKYYILQIHVILLRYWYITEK